MPAPPRPTHPTHRAAALAARPCRGPASSRDGRRWLTDRTATNPASSSGGFTSSRLQLVAALRDVVIGSMRVLVWSDLFWPYIGGPELFVARLMTELRERGYDFLVVTSQDYLPLPAEASYEGIPIRRIPFRAAIRDRDVGALVEARQQVAELKRSYSPDLVHANSVGPSLMFHLWTLAAHPAPWLVQLQQEVLASQSGKRDTLLRQALLSASWVVAVSETLLAQAKRVAPEIGARSSVIRRAVDPAPELGEEFPPERPRLVCLGRLVHAKGFDVALTAFASLVDRFPALRMTIAGDGAMRQDLERQAAALGVDTAVDFMGWVDPDQVLEVLGEATVVVMPSRREGLPHAALQAASMARPIVASRVGGLPEVVAHNESGMLVERDDVPGLTDAIAFLLENPGEAARMGQAARKRVQDTLSFGRSVEAYDALFRTLIRRSECPP
jgi:glycogen synthase